MELSQQKEAFSNAYFQAVVAVAGYALAKPSPDEDGIDWIVCARSVRETPRSPRLEVQLKCTARGALDDTDLRFPLEVHYYESLCREAHLPRILVVVTVPEQLENWMSQTEEEMILRYCGYWVSLRGAQGTANTNNITVRLPRAQQFTPDALREMMRRINDGGMP
jgi:hypothetical protein